MPLLPISHYPQPQQTDCLAACTAMVLHYLQVPFQYDQLLRLLRIGLAGTSFQNLRHLKTVGLRITIERGNIDTLRASIQNGLPPIVFLATGELAYWNEQTNHAVVVVGIDNQTIYLNDPAFTTAPQAVSIDEFALAWLEMDEFYALIQT